MGSPHHTRHHPGSALPAHAPEPLRPALPLWCIELGEPGVVPLGQHLTASADRVLRLAVHCGDPAGEGFDPTLVWPGALPTGGSPRPGPVRLVDQHGHRPPSDAQVSCLVTGQWNLLEVHLPDDGPVPDDDPGPAPGTELALDCPRGQGRVWVQVLPAAPTWASEGTASPAEQVRTTRGTHGGPDFSRGNTLPAACLPHGGVLITPVTNARTRQWVYQWTPVGGPHLEALAFSHQPSPWIGERGAVQVMPWRGTPHVDPRRRRLAFDHDDEYDRPHHYRVRLADGTLAEATPTLHGGLFRFTFEDGATADGGSRGVVLDLPGRGRWQWRELADGRLELSARVEPSPGFGRRRSDPVMFCHGQTRQPVRVLRQGRRRAVVLESSGPEQMLEIALATSHVSIAQARHNLRLQVGERSFEALRDHAKDRWDELLGRLELPDATPRQRVIAWSNLYRLHCWPMAFHENAASAEQPRWVHASPFADTSYRRRLRTPADRTHLPVLAGKLFVNNGFWDTYRTCWPALGLLFPDWAEPLVEGLLPAFRESGWMGRWSAPGHVDSMVGTSSDVILADASAQGVAFDELTGYDSALRNACCPPADATVGRKGIGSARFRGWVASDEVPEAFSWSIENAICDAAIARWSRALAERCEELGAGERREEFLANALWFTNRALAVQHHFDPDSGLWRGRRADGRWSTRTIDPLAWGGDHTESTAWTMSASLPWDGALLTALHGRGHGIEEGEQALAQHLDRLVSIPEHADRPGSYRRVIHEMREARALRLGQCALSNQPAHHLPFMHLHVGQPWRSQQIVGEALDRLFVGDEIGQGYPGDEDNGELSAWWLLAATGLYPLAPGSGEVVLGAPLFSTRWHRPEGRLTVTAAGQGSYIAAVSLDGEAWHEVSIPIERLRGEVEIRVERSPEPTGWGADSRPWSLSTSPLGRDWGPWRPDRSSSARWTLDAAPAPLSLWDDKGDHPVPIAAGSRLRGEWSRAWRPRLLTLTARQAALPRVVAVLDGKRREVAVRHPGPRWPRQSVALLLDGDPLETVELHFDQPVELLQVEVL
ncbi:GH92 family glycosyl hydrolase [Luteococcus sp. OSA5]|uniref:GH92 family glycosyl hydrolase n=1 Tax=Luteococcus sp. OSA5 TaxID=3401630 RepID=UPI003B42FDCB